MPDDFLIARNPEPDSTLPYLLRIPLGSTGIVVKAKDTWPRTSRIYCHRATEWPAEPEILERTRTRDCTRRGAAIDLVLDRGRENRSQFVLTYARGREAIFWQSARTAKQARPNVRTPTARALGVEDVEILVDVHERYAWTFPTQQVRTRKHPLPAGDYAICLGESIVAAVERKSLADLVATLTGGKLRYLLAELAALPRAALVVEERYSQVFALDRVRPAVVADGLAEAQARFPTVPIVFTDTRALAQEWTYRFLVACRQEISDTGGAVTRVADLTTGIPLPAAEPTLAEIRRWAIENGYAVSDRGRIAASIRAAYANRADAP